MIENMNMNLNSFILEKQTDGDITEKSEKVSDNFYEDYQGKLAVLDDQGVPYGEVDDLLITQNPEHLIIVKDTDHKPSIEIMSGAIEKTSNNGLSSIAISSDTIEEIELVREQIRQLMLEDPNIQKVGFIYPDNK